MRGRGVARPKEDQHRGHHSPIGEHQLDAQESLLGFPLPRMDDFTWHPQTISWWLIWRKSPQAKHFLDTDWQSLLEVARLHSSFWAAGDPRMRATLSAEVAKRVGKFGSTLEDRARLRMKMAPPIETPAGVTAPVIDYKSRLKVA